MKKIITFILIALMLMTLTATFVGCGDKDVTDLKNQFDDLSNKFNDLSNQYNELDERVKKLETTMSLLDTVGESEQFTELKNKVTALQKDLVSNTASDTQIKSQITQMQLVLDKISGGGNVDPAILGEIQNKLNTLYGEVNRVMPFENGKEYEVKLNGVVYYTVSVLIEYHDGIMQSQQDIKKCISTEKHFCASISICNRMTNFINADFMPSMMLHLYDDYISQSVGMYNKIGYSEPDIKQIGYGESVRWYFYVTPNAKAEKNYKIVFRIQNISLNVLVLDNVWGDENGLKPPIVGTK